ncbi:hypothetical protein AAC387_Pa05g3331 [Persea americana]
MSAVSSFPPLRAEENRKINFTADESGGKAAIASFPPLTEEENWKMRFTADESSDLELSGPNQQAAGQMELVRRSSIAT